MVFANRLIIVVLSMSILTCRAYISSFRSHRIPLRTKSRCGLSVRLRCQIAPNDESLAQPTNVLSQATQDLQQEVTKLQQLQLAIQDNIRASREKLASAEKEFEVMDAEYGGEIDRLKKEYARIRERAREEYSDVVNKSVIDTVKDVLPTLDNFARAQQAYNPLSTPNEIAIMAFYEGIFHRLAEIVNTYGVTRVDSVGQPFDVKFMEALQTMPSEYPEGTVVLEYQPGYKMGSKCVIPALVVVSSGPNAGG